MSDVTNPVPFTPGPWTAGRRQVRGGGLHLARVYSVPRAGQTRANLRLMAAGPTMYAALEDALAAMESMSPPILTHPAMQSVRDALAKARGEDPEPAGGWTTGTSDTSGADPVPPPAPLAPGPE